MKLYYRELSSGYIEEQVKSPIIFLHAMALSGKTFKTVAPIISKKTKRKVYIPDARNHGYSPWINEMSYDALTNDLLNFMEECNIQRAILIGHSMGGRTAMNFALKYPDKVDALIIEDMTPKNILSKNKHSIVQLLKNFLIEFLKNSPPEASLEDVKETAVDAIFNSMPPRYLVDKEQLLKHFDWDIIPVLKDENGFRMECNVDVVTSLIEEDSLVQNLPDKNLNFHGDALFVYGSKGFFNLDKDSSIRKLFPRATVKRIEGSSHLIHVDSPHIYSQIVSDFILHRTLPESKY